MQSLTIIAEVADGIGMFGFAVGNFCNDGEGLHHGGVSIVIPS